MKELKMTISIIAIIISLGVSFLSFIVLDTKMRSTCYNDSSEIFSVTKNENEQTTVKINIFGKEIIICPNEGLDMLRNIVG